MGYEEAEGETADLCIVNTCTVTEGADSSSRHEIRHLSQAKSECPNRRHRVSCGKAPEEIESDSEGVDLSFPIKIKNNLLIRYSLKRRSRIFHPQFGAHTRAFVKVQDGCNSFCTYCIIPYVRGRSRSRRLRDCGRGEGLIANGYKEVVITGINVGDFDGPAMGRKPFVWSISSVLIEVEGLKRLRISSIDPDEVDDELSMPS